MKTIAIVTPKIDTFSNPTLTLIIEKLIEENYKILFFGFEQLFIPRELKAKMDFYTLPFNFYKSKKDLNALIKNMNQCYELYKLLKIENRVKALICVDPMGLVIAGRIQRLVNLKIIYASFEIFFEDEFYIQKKKILKVLERKYSQKVDSVIIQDPAREKLLREVNDFNPKTKFLRIPVSPKRLKVNENNLNLHESQNIPEDKTIVVYSGTLLGWSGVSDLLDIFKEKWNKKFWLLLHSHHSLDDKNEIKLKIDELIKSKQQISFHDYAFYNFEDYAKFLLKCDIGIATYFPNSVDIFAGKNLQEIGLSSGKFSSYMMLEKPTVTTSNPIYKQLNEKYNFGEVINTMADLPEALNKILENYETKVHGCRELFDNELDPELKIENLFSEINNYYI